MLGAGSVGVQLIVINQALRLKIVNQGIIGSDVIAI